ncbi:MAG: ATP-binding cassette domain-containing protein [candidate division Zixibacteria bacterium]|jgi:sodium transport system ATP-binding protein|nr:ATP-binding cassette domain-containing protein [candidate division Zixibacteria bacterium]
MITVKNLTKVFEDKKRGRIVAVDNISFEVNRGEIFGLLGLNGAGKTTTLRLLATILKPTSGTASLDGLDVVKSPEKAKAKLGFLTGATGLYARLQAREMIRYFGLLYGMSEADADKRTDELIAIFNLKDFAAVKCDKLSSGNKQKVSIARTMVHDPEVIILDEPTVGLDVITSRAVVNFVNDEKKRGKAIIFSTHVMHEAEKLCDRIGIIHYGKIIAVGTPDELKTITRCNDMDDVFVKLVEDNGNVS